MRAPTSEPFPRVAGFLLGIGLGGLFDGIVLHQVLQWHHMVSSAGFPPDTVENLELNTLLDGLFHVFAYACVVAGLALLWQRARRGRIWWSTRHLVGTVLVGFGAFNMVEGIVNHHLLGLHHVNETVPREMWMYWDVGFLVWGLAMWLGGAWLLKSRRRLELHDGFWPGTGLARDSRDGRRRDTP